ncbi:MAG: nuclear transport factor 2 family protein [Chitinophagaceae bacterium]
MQDEAITRQLVTDFLQRLSIQDADGLQDLFADEIDWYVPGNPALPWTGVRSVRTAVAAYFRKLWQLLAPGKSIVTPGSIVIQDEAAVVFASFTHTVAATGTVFHNPVALHITIAGNRIYKLHLYEDTWVVSNAFLTSLEH